MRTHGVASAARCGSFSAPRGYCTGFAANPCRSSARRSYALQPQLPGPSPIARRSSCTSPVVSQLVPPGRRPVPSLVVKAADERRAGSRHRSALLLGPGRSSALLSRHRRRLGEPLFYVLLIAAVLRAAADDRRSSRTSASRRPSSAACSRSGSSDPLAAFLIPVVAEGVGWAGRALPLARADHQLAGSATPTALAARRVRGARPWTSTARAFPIVLGLFGAAVLLVNGLIVAPLMRCSTGGRCERPSACRPDFCAGARVQHRR